MHNPVTEPYLLNALAHGAVVVLPNRRAARTLRQAYNEQQRTAGLRAWDAAPVLAWAEWTRGLWSGLAVQGHELRLLLSPAQEHRLWREIIEASLIGPTLSSPDALAEMARPAWTLAAAHRATSRIRATSATFDTRTFAGWAERFRKTCAGEGYISSAEVEEALRTHAGSGVLRLEGSVLLAGFEEFTPAQSALIEELRASGAQITEVTLEAAARSASERVSTVVPTSRDEIVFGARWIRQLFADRSLELAIPRIAVLVPRPEEDRAELESVFRTILAPELQPIEADNSATPWEFSAGSALPAQPMISDALAILRLAQGPLSIERLGALLRSPFIGVSSEHVAAARFDANILRRARTSFLKLTWMGLPVSFASNPGRAKPRLLSRVGSRPSTTSARQNAGHLLRAATPNGRRSSAIYCVPPIGLATERQHLMSSPRPGHGTRHWISLQHWISAARA